MRLASRARPRWMARQTPPCKGADKSLGNHMYPVLTQAAIFVLGALAGAVIQRYADRILSWGEGRFARRRVRIRSAQLADGFDGRGFSFCGIKISIYVAVFDPRGIARNDIVTLLTDEVPEIEGCNGYEQLQDQERAYWQGRLDDNKIFNGKTLALREHSPIRHGRDERCGLRLEFTRGDYLTQRIRTGVYQKLSPQDRKSVLARPAEIAPFFSNTFGVSLAVITLDGEAVFVRRGSRTAVNTGKIVCGVVEGMGENDMRSGRPDPYMTAFRGLEEELGIRVDPEQSQAVELFSLILNTDYYEWGMLGIADFRQCRNQAVTSGYLRELWASAKGRDKYESDSIEFVPFNPEAIGRYLLKNLSDVVNYAFVATVYALLREYPRQRVAAALEPGGPAYVGMDEMRLHSGSNG